ncbi:hypothetical protein MTO96_047896 [Rhipicephalus appendiculatus]
MLSTSVHQQSNATLVQIGQTVSCHFRDFPCNVTRGELFRGSYNFQLGFSTFAPSGCSPAWAKPGRQSSTEARCEAHNALEVSETDLRCGRCTLGDTTSLVFVPCSLLRSLKSASRTGPSYHATRPGHGLGPSVQPSCWGTIMLFVILWLLVRKYSIAPVAEPPKGEEALSDGAPSQRPASKTSMLRADGMPSAATGRAASPALGSGARPGAKTQCTTSLPLNGDNHPEMKPRLNAEKTGTGAQNKPKASSGWVVANARDKDASKQPSKTNIPAEDKYVAPTGAVKQSSVEGQPGTDGVMGTSVGQAAREEISVGTSAERTTATEQRHRKKKSKKQHRDGGGSDGGGSESSAIPEAGGRSRHDDHETKAQATTQEGFQKKSAHKGGSFVPKSHSSSRRPSTKSRTSRKSTNSEDARSDATASAPAGWTSGQAPAENVVAAPATAETAATGDDDDIFLSKLPKLGGKDVQPPTPPHPNMDVFSREHSSMIAVAEPVGTALTPPGEGASGQNTPNVIHSPTGAARRPLR